MKQYISEDIVNKELADVQRSELKHSLESFNNWDGSLIKTPGLSIGQMIEFLIDHKENERACQILGAYSHTVMQGDMQWQEYSSLEDLCDNLWEAVKESLHKANLI